jgi:nitrate reductase gamma subunit
VGKGPLYFWIYVFYLSKYYEWADTALMCLKKVQLRTFPPFHSSLLSACLLFMRLMIVAVTLCVR